jgi:mannan endo-1,4-beta-mannosidase
MIKSLLFLLLLCVQSVSASDFERFITRDGHQLKEGEQDFRFAGFNAPELHRIEDDAKGVCKDDRRGWGQHFKWPTSDEQKTWIKSLVGTGHKATRIYVLSVQHVDDVACQRETHILKPLTPSGMPVLNETAMVVYDQMIAHASEYKLRLILPFIDHWQWWGGREQLAAFYGEPQDEFYNINSQTFKAYLDIIRQVITRKNTITGRYYFEEKSIMAWETGNELKASTPEFVRVTAAHIKSLAPQQLVVDGNYLSILEHSLNDDNIDIINNHFYTVNNNNKSQTIIDDLTHIAGRKAYLVGEYGLKPYQGIDEIMQTAVNHEVNGASAIGAFIWGYRGHRHNGGFYWHKEGDGSHYSYHLPGFSEGDANEELKVTQLVRVAQAQMNGLNKPLPLAVPEAPNFRTISPDRKFTWMGSPLGRSYNVERKLSSNNNWVMIAEKISDGKNRFDPEIDVLFQDKGELVSGESYDYRIIAVNESGQSEPSNTLTIKLPISTNNFVTVENGQFYRNDKPYHFIGTNYWYGPLIAAKNGNRARLHQELDQLKQYGVTNLRILVGADGGLGNSVVKPALQLSPGKYNNDLLEGLDYLLIEMKKRNMVAVLYLTNNWIWSGGMSQYLNWHSYGDVPNPFAEGVTWDDYMSYTKQFHRCEPCTNDFYKHTKFIISRRNSLTGKLYSEDPTIMSWQLSNEPRVFASDNYQAFKSWVDISVALIERLAPNQLISTGNEGAAGSLNSVEVYQKLHDNAAIDYLTMHIWPKNWGWYSKEDQVGSTRIAINKAKQYMSDHLVVAKQLNRPIVLSEFGFPRHLESLSPLNSTLHRDTFFTEIFQQVLSSKQSQGNLAGLNFWAYGGFGRENLTSKGQWIFGDDYLGDPAQEPQGLNTVFSSDAKTLAIIASFNKKLSK